MRNAPEVAHLVIEFDVAELGRRAPYSGYQFFDVELWKCGQPNQNDDMYQKGETHMQNPFVKQTAIDSKDVQTLSDMLLNQTSGGVQDLIWGPAPSLTLQCDTPFHLFNAISTYFTQHTGVTVTLSREGSEETLELTLKGPEHATNVTASKTDEQSLISVFEKVALKNGGHVVRRL